MNRTCADLSVSGDLVRDTGVDHRRDAFLYHFSCVDAKADSLEVPGRNCEVRVSVDDDLHHLVAGAKCIFVSACSYESGNSRSRDHSHTADAEGLCDGALAHIRAGILAVISGKEKSLRSINRTCEPLVAQTCDTDTELITISAHSGYNGSIGSGTCVVHYCLAGSHHDI